jgi:ribonucleoside-diphosphate reductase alpha chain
MKLNDNYFLNPAHLELAKARYFLKNDNGELVEQDIDEVFNRVVNCVYRDDKEHKEEALRLRREKKIIDAGRPLAQAGTGISNLYNCFCKNTIVTTTSGPKKISDVNIGDYVITHTGSYEKVVQVHKNKMGNRPLYRIKCARTPEIVVTHNHRFWSISRNGNNLGWNSICNLNVGDFIAIPKPKHHKLLCKDTINILDHLCIDKDRYEIQKKNGMILSRTIFANRGQKDKTCHEDMIPIKDAWPINKDFAFFLGVWLGDGCIYNTSNGRIAGITFQTNINEQKLHKFLVQFGSKLFGFDPSVTYNVEQNTKTIYFSSQIVGKVFNSLFGRGFANKRLPNFVFNWDYSLVSSLLAGLISSDGTISKNGTCKIEIRNKKLVEQMYYLSRQCGIPVSMRTGYVIYRGEKRSTAVLQIPKGHCVLKQVIKYYDDERIVKSFETSKANEFKSIAGLMEKDGQYFVKINKKVISNVKYDFVYNIGVENSHSYNVEGVVCENCFVFAFGDKVNKDPDTREAISELKRKHFNIQAQGGGTGINFSSLRPAGSICKTNQSKSSGAVGFITDVSYQSSNIQQGGNRSGANLGVLDDWHPDLYDFITHKTKNNWENIRKFATVYDEDGFSYFQWRTPHQWQMFNVSVMLSDEFIGKVIKNDNDPWKLQWKGTEWYLWKFKNTQGPRTGRKYDREIIVTAPNEELAFYKAKSKIPFFNNNGLELVNGPYHMSAPEWFDLICKSAHEDGCPGILFSDMAREYHNGEYFNPISAANPCAEELLPANSVCCLASLILPSFFVNGKFLWDEFSKAIYQAVRGLDNVISISKTGEKEIDENALLERRIGLGTTGIGELLIMAGLKYSSQKARDFTAKILEFFRDKAYESSIELAKEKGPFPAYEYKGFSQSKFFKTLPNKIKNLIKRHGIRNVTVLCQPPTGTVGTMVGYSTGCEPYFAMCYIRNSRVGTFKDGSPSFINWLDKNNIDYSEYNYNISKLKESIDVPDYFEEAHAISWEDHLKMQAVFSKYIDASISKTINMPNDATVDDVKNVYITAYKMGIKSTTVYRDGSKQQVLELASKGSDKRPNDIVRAHAPKRPLELPCDIHHTSVRGDKWTVLVGLLDGRPYEVFCAPQDNFEIAPKYKNGIMVKNGGGSYYLDTGDFKLKNISSYLNTDEHKVITRLLSTCLRHGVPMPFISDQLAKADGTIVDFSKAILRVLKKYGDIPSHCKKNKICETCGSTNIVVKSGCPECLDCGTSKCG